MSYQPKSHRKFLTTSLTAAMVAGAVAPAAVSAATADFSDLTGEYYDEAIKELASNGHINGYDDGSFKPENQINRAEAATVLTSVHELSVSGDINYSDVDSSDWFSDEVRAVSNAGIFQGYNGAFNPETNLTRQEAATIIVNSFDLQGEGEATTFTDISGEWGEDYIKVAAENGVISGYDAQTFAPNDNIKRGDFAVMINRAVKATSDSKIEVESVSAVDATNIEVTFEDETVVEVELDEALVHGENEVTFEVDGVEYTETVEYVDAAVVAIEEATEAVEVAEASLLVEDVEAAQELVTDLSASDEKTLLQARITQAESDIEDVIDAVNAATGELDLYRALDTVPFVNVYEDYITEYKTAIDVDGDFDTTAAIQDEIDTVNATQLDADIEAATNAVNVVDYTADQTEEEFYADVDAAQELIDVLPSDYVVDADEDETPLVEQLQADLDEQVKLYDEFVNIVTPIVDASSEIELYNELTVNFDSALEANIGVYDFAGFTTIEEVQYEIDFVNAENTINAFTVDADTTQDDIDELTALVPVTDEDADGEPTPTTAEQGLLNTVDDYQTEFDALVDATADLAVAVEEAEAAQADYLAAGGDEEDTVYADVTADLEAAADVDVDVTSDIVTVTTNLEDTTGSLESATEALNALSEAVAEAEAAQADYLAAGGDEEDTVYADVTAALDAETQETTDIEDATSALEAETEELVLVDSINSAETASDLEPLLVKLENNEYNNLTSVQRLEIAELSLEVIAEGEFTSTLEISEAIYADNGEDAATGVIVEYNASITAVNDASSITATDLALEDLDLEEYNTLSSSEQLDIAENVLNNKPTDSEGTVTGYTSINQIVDNF